MDLTLDTTIDIAPTPAASHITSSSFGVHLRRRRQEGEEDLHSPGRFLQKFVSIFYDDDELENNKRLYPTASPTMSPAPTIFANVHGDDVQVDPLSATNDDFTETPNSGAAFHLRSHHGVKTLLVGFLLASALML